MTDFGICIVCNTRRAVFVINGRPACTEDVDVVMRAAFTPIRAIERQKRQIRKLKKKVKKIERDK